MIKQMFSGFLRIHILHHAALKPIYGAEMIEELRRHGYKVGPGTVYPILHQMENGGLLESYKMNVEGKIRIYYEITAQGQEMLSESKMWLRELVNEVLGEEGRI